MFFPKFGMARAIRAWLERSGHGSSEKIIFIPKKIFFMSKKTFFEKKKWIFYFFIKIQFFAYKPCFNPINRPWDPSRSIDLVKIYIWVDLELHRTYLGPIYPLGTQGTQGGPPWTNGPLRTHGPYGPWALWTLGPWAPWYGMACSC